MKKSRRCLLDLTHALHKCTDVNSAVTWSNPRWIAISRLPQTIPLTPTFMHIFICFSCELIMGQPPHFHTHIDWLHLPVNYRELKKTMAVLPLGLVFVLLKRLHQCTVCGESVDDVIKRKMQKKKQKTGALLILKRNEHLIFCNIFNSEDFMQENKSYCNIPCHL